MKLSFYSLFMFSLASLICSSAKALDQSTLQRLASQGMVVVNGELTGAGAKASVNRLHAVVYRDEVKRVNQSEVKLNHSGESTLKDIESVKVETLEVFANELDGFVIKK